MKYLFSLIIVSFYFIGCSSTLDTINLGAEERLKYAVGLYNDEDYLEAVNEFQALILQYPGNVIADDAQYYLAMTRYKREEYVMAAFEFSKLIKNMPASEFVPESQYMLAECYYKLSPSYSLDQRYSKKAIEEYQAFIDFFPANAKVQEAEAKIDELNEKLAEKEYNSAYIYVKLEYYTAALIFYNSVIDTYHDTKYAPLAMYDKINLLADRGRNSEALAEIAKYVQRYPDNARIGELERLKNTLENKLSAAR
jgi:outer membrane protein assembly factor BamD